MFEANRGRYAEALQMPLCAFQVMRPSMRRSVVRNASYVSQSQVHDAPENYEPETAFHYGQQSTVTSVCSIVEITTSLFGAARPPVWLGWRGNHQHAYVWAGSDWPWQFVERSPLGATAGDVCTKLIIYESKSP
jgi:hypothetical protein